MAATRRGPRFAYKSHPDPQTFISPQQKRQPTKILRCFNTTAVVQTTLGHAYRQLPTHAWIPMGSSPFTAASAEPSIVSSSWPDALIHCLGIPLKMRFQAPQLGALGVTFTAFRAMQFVSLIAIVGLTANFINEFVTTQREVPDVLVGTLSVASIATLYVAISYILYYDSLLPLLIAGGMDLSLTVASIVVAVTVGKPLPMLRCEALPEPVSETATFTMSISARGYSSAAAKYNSYLALITKDQPHCYQIKAVWGLGIALCVLFAFSALGYAGAQGGSWEKAVAEKRSFAGVRQISGPTALGTRLLSPRGPDPGLQFMPPPPPPLTPSAPEPVHRRSALRSLDQDVQPTPAPPPIILSSSANSTVILGRSLTGTSAPPAPAIVPPPASMPFMPSTSPTEAFIPIMHRRPVPAPINTNTNPVVMPPIPPTPSDDGFAPAAADPSPRQKKGWHVSRAAPLSPRDALGIPISKFMRTRSRRAQICHVDDDDDLDDNKFGDTAPLSPRDLGASAHAVAGKTATGKPKRKTLFGVLEGWWDLGLLERGKSLRRK
ncbi:hypothetical protein F4778DRAFT_784092 [Xylariomycetidae sp. FL2044]|nr:hypothetical protein F4778DRAFT_784092 [Xylariomycetidae sp. FL2044]